MTLPSLSRSNLVIVRAGGNSLHPGWMGAGYATRNFDLVVSYFDDAAFASHIPQDGVHALLVKGGKWDGLSKTIDSLGEEIWRYEYFWLPDDDIQTDVETVNQLFVTMRTKSLKVAQPSLTPDSYFTHFLFINCPRTSLRFTNYIEIMVPCLERGVMKEIWPHFKNSRSGFGLDYVWCRLPQIGMYGAAIIDSLQVRHTRPIGKVLMSAMKSEGISPKDEEKRLNDAYGITVRITPLVHALVPEVGRIVHGKVSAGFSMAIRHLKFLVAAPSAHRRYGFPNIYHLVRRQLTRKLDLSPLEPIESANSAKP